MHFISATYIGYVDIAGRSPAKGRQASAGLGNVSNSFARWSYYCWILRWRHFSFFDKKKNKYI